jgi:hypothetical protein
MIAFFQLAGGSLRAFVFVERIVSRGTWRDQIFDSLSNPAKGLIFRPLTKQRFSFIIEVRQSIVEQPQSSE